MKDHVTCNGIMRPCCADESRRILVSSVIVDGWERRTEKCRECNRNHYTLVAAPVRFGIAGAAMG